MNSPSDNDHHQAFLMLANAWECTKQRIEALIALLPRNPKTRRAADAARIAVTWQTNLEQRCQEFWRQKLVQMPVAAATQTDVDKVFAGLSDMELHNERTLALCELLEAFLLYHCMDGQGSPYSEETAGAVSRLLFDHREELSATVGAVGELWGTVRPALRMTGEAPPNDYKATGGTEAQKAKPRRKGGRK